MPEEIPPPPAPDEGGELDQDLHDRILSLMNDVGTDDDDQ